MPNLKFLLDENVSNKTVRRLKKAGLSIESAQTHELFGKENGEILAYASKNHYCLLTFDRDFLDFSQEDHWGIIVCLIHPIKDEIAGPVIERFLKDLEFSQVKGQIIILEKDNWRIKS